MTKVDWFYIRDDELPPTEQVVLVCCVNEKGKPFVRTGRRDKTGRWLIAGDIDGVYAWSYLPDAPVGSELACPCALYKESQYDKYKMCDICVKSGKELPCRAVADNCKYFTDYRKN